MIKNYELKYHLEPIHVAGREDTTRGFAILDLCYEIGKLGTTIENLLIIDSLVVDSEFRSMGIGSECLKAFCESYGNKIILVESGAHTEEYFEEPTEKEYLNILKRLRNFYTNVGFVNVNNVIGHYQFKEAFIYKNDASEQLLKQLLENDSMAMNYF